MMCLLDVFTRLQTSTPQAWPRPGGSLRWHDGHATVHDGGITVDISWTAAPGQGPPRPDKKGLRHTTTKLWRRGRALRGVLKNTIPAGRGKPSPRPCRLPSRKSNIPPPRKGQAPPTEMPQFCNLLAWFLPSPPRGPVCRSVGLSAPWEEPFKRRQQPPILPGRLPWPGMVSTHTPLPVGKACVYFFLNYKKPP